MHKSKHSIRVSFDPRNKLTTSDAGRIAAADKRPQESLMTKGKRLKRCIVSAELPRATTGRTQAAFPRIRVCGNALTDKPTI